MRVGIINIMPRAETYESYLLRPLRASGLEVEPVWVRLSSHVYSSSDIRHVRSRYSTFDELSRRAPIDGLILTGAPVEELAFEEVRYYRELSGILEHARDAGIGTLGLCWGGMMLGHLVGLPKVIFQRKLFGVFEQQPLDPGHALTHDLGDRFPCAHSRHSGILDADLERASAAGTVRLLAHGPDTGYALFESADGLFVAHLGHPEYPAERLREEWERDTALGRTDLDPPRNVDGNHPVATWQPHCDRLFSNWLARLERARSERAQA
jgi:homoserine O-succinyltransferase